MNADPEFRCGPVECHIVYCSTGPELQTRILLLTVTNLLIQTLKSTRTYTMIVFRAFVEKKTEK